MNRVGLQKVLWKYGYNTLANKKKGEEKLKEKGIKKQNLSIYLRNGYIVHIKPEFEPVFDFYDDIIESITNQNGKKNHIIFSGSEVATIQVRHNDFVEA